MTHRIQESILENVQNNDDFINLQLAAELGKTLLERNQELEENSRRLQSIIEDQSKEIEYLTIETSQLRDTNEARLRIYEALEQSVGDLEKTNRLLQDEGKTDKKRIKALCASLEMVEQHCEELQEEVTTIKGLSEMQKLTQTSHGNRKNQQRNGHKHSDYTSSEDSNTDEESGILGSDESDFAGFEDTPLEMQEVLRLRSDLASVRSQISREQRMRDNLSSELERSIQENARLREELLASRERERLSLNIQMDMGVVGKNISEEQFNDLVDEKNCETGTSTSDSELPEQEEGTTLLYELDMQYRVLIEKYEALLDARRRDIEAEDEMTASMHSQVHSDAGIGTDVSTTPECIAVASNEEEVQETSKQSCDVGCQTDIQVLKKKFENTAVTQAPRSCSKLPGLVAGIPVTYCPRKSSTSSLLSTLSDADQETFNKHFEHTPPEYKKLFAEIFAVLKRKVAEMPTCATGVNDRQTSPSFTVSDIGSRIDCSLDKLKATVPQHIRSTRSYAEVVRARQQQAQQIRSQAQRNIAMSAYRNLSAM